MSGIRMRSVIISGFDMPGSAARLPEWEQLLSSAARLQQILPEAVLVGGTAAAIHAEHRFSLDADHVLTDLRVRFDEVLQQLESVAGWRTARVARPVQIPGSLDGIQTGVRQLIRSEPLETTTLDVGEAALTIPTEAEILRIKGVLILKRNATRDYLDFVALATHMGADSSGVALRSFDRLYPQESGESALQQLQAQLANPLPYDLDELDLSEYRDLAAEWQDWGRVKVACGTMAVAVFDHVCDPPK